MIDTGLPRCHAFNMKPDKLYVTIVNFNIVGFYMDEI